MKDEDRQVISLESQEFELRTLAKREGDTIVEFIKESQSAKLPGRPEFNKMLDRIEAGEANGIICWDVDRLYRNPIDEGRVRWLLQRGVIHSIRTPGRQYFPRDAGLLMAVEGGRSIEHILSMSRNLKRTLEAKLRNGQWPGQRFFGYSFDHRLKNVVPVPETAPVILELFNEFAQGELGFESGARWLESNGIVSSSGKPFSKSEMRRILTNKKLAGMIPWKGQLYEGRFKPIVPLTLFNKVQAVIKKKSRPKKTRKGHVFPFRGLFTCSCGSMITAQWARGRHGGLYRYYRCTKKGGQCAERYVQEKDLAKQCLQGMRHLAISTIEANEIRSLIGAKEDAETATLAESSKEIEQKLSNLDEKLRTLTRRLVDEIIDEDMYLAAKADLVTEKTLLVQEKNRLKRERCNYWIEPSKDLISTLETLGSIADTASPQEVANIFRKIGTNPLLSNKTATFSFSKNYAFMASLLVSARSVPDVPEAKRCVDFAQSSKWCAWRELNPQPAASEAVTLSN